MSHRRINEYCEYHEIHNLKNRPVNGDWQHFNSALREDYGDSLFPYDPEVCGKAKQVIAETEVKENGKTYIIRNLACGHYDIQEKSEFLAKLQRNVLWDNLLPFQKEFIEFAERHDCRVINRDKMGLGKTVQALSLYRENADRFTGNFNKYCGIVSPVGGIFQWEEEAMFWLGIERTNDLKMLSLMPQVLWITNQNLNPFCKTIIVPWTRLSDKKFLQTIDGKLGSLIVDEAHFFKNENSARSQNLIKLIKMVDKGPLVFLSGTLSENRVDDIFIPLNAVDPAYFSSRSNLARMCTRAENGKVLSIAPYWRGKFFERTNKYMIGRTKENVNVPLPKLELKRVECDPEDFAANRQFINDYNSVVDDLENILALPELNAGSIIGLMQQMRHITGKMKILSIATWANTFLQLEENEKLCIGVHHISVREALCTLLKSWNPLSMSDENPAIKDQIEKDFREGKSRLLICSVLSAGVGRNLQFCRNAIIAERQWNKSKEDQFRERFHRIMRDDEGRIRTQFSDKDTVRVWTHHMYRTFDEFFDTMVHLKGIITDSTDENVEELPDEYSIIELARQVVTNRIKILGV